MAEKMKKAPPAAPKQKQSSYMRRSKAFTFWLFLFPSLFAFVMVIVIPFALGIYYSFTDWSPSSLSVNWIGLDNYRGLSDPRFLHSFMITAVYAVLNIIAVNVVAFLLALLVTSRFKGRNFFRSGFFVPNLIGGLVLGYVWQFIFNRAVPAFGQSFGIEWLDTLFLTRPNSALAAIVIVGTWQYAGYIMMVYIAGLQSVPDSLLEAGQIDGANYRQRLRHIVFPMIAPAFTIATFLTLTTSFKQFDVNVSLTGGDPPKMFMDTLVKGTEFFALNIYTEAFSFFRMGSAQARAVVFFLVLVAVSLVQVYFNKRREVEL